MPFNRFTIKTQNHQDTPYYSYFNQDQKQCLIYNEDSKVVMAAYLDKTDNVNVVYASGPISLDAHSIIGSIYPNKSALSFIYAHVPFTPTSYPRFGRLFTQANNEIAQQQRAKKIHQRQAAPLEKYLTQNPNAIFEITINSKRPLIAVSQNGKLYKLYTWQNSSYTESSSISNDIMKIKQSDKYDVSHSNIMRNPSIQQNHPLSNLKIVHYTENDYVLTFNNEIVYSHGDIPNKPQTGSEVQFEKIVRDLKLDPTSPADLAYWASKVKQGGGVKFTHQSTGVTYTVPHTIKNALDCIERAHAERKNHATAATVREDELNNLREALKGNQSLSSKLGLSWFTRSKEVSELKKAAVENDLSSFTPK